MSYIFEHILLNLWPLEVFARLSMATQVEMSARYERVINIVCTHMHHMFITMCLLMHVSLYPTDMRTEGLHPYPFTSSLPTWVSTLVWGGFPNELRKNGHFFDKAHGRIIFIETIPEGPYIYQ